MTSVAPHPVDETLGLRERKKRETARAIEVAAVELVAEFGLSEVTVDAISHRADVTSRTFFNYFASKEDAVIGASKAFGPPVVPPIAYQPGVPVLDTLIAAVRDEIASIDFGTPELQAQRRAVALANPSLLVKDFQRLGAIEEDLAQQAQRLLREEGRVPARERADRAWAIVMFAGAVLRLGLQTWTHETGVRRPIAEHIESARLHLLGLAADLC
ncbi:TetR/AcrR family transcriptional regulator [Herbiconiux ginsengi]|uniref:Transcriptional regulator, TetR family n=1 Tax=Herbiconiux ginsengi TaxID=381665 RepID=A0A1H3S1P2_9MICO|nr:TetR/AcrR family transcriptional regulator [Herbiconiux ginsengi]SDZ31852.1 transcriptional regulator, TetR family [Herbiconiux ginsengi]